MREVIIISRCQKIRKTTTAYRIGEFHFKGVYSGDLIKRLCLRINSNVEVKVNEDYILHVKFEMIKGDVLTGEVIRLKNLDACFCKD